MFIVKSADRIWTESLIWEKVMMVLIKSNRMASVTRIDYINRLPYSTVQPRELSPKDYVTAFLTSHLIYTHRVMSEHLLSVQAADAYSAAGHLKAAEYAKPSTTLNVCSVNRMENATTMAIHIAT